MSRKIIYFLIIIATVGFILGAMNVAFAQEIDLGVAEVDSAIALSSTDPIVIATRLINYILIVLGILTVGLIIYAGFLWMASGGNEEKVAQAKKTLTNAVIGLVIILSAWGITLFILDKLMGATNGGSSTGLVPPYNLNPLIGSGALGSCTIERVYPEPGQTNVARNTAIIISFKEQLKLDTICVDDTGNSCTCDNSSNCNLINPSRIKIFRDDLGDTCPLELCDPNSNTNITNAEVNFSTSSDEMTLIIKPLDLLGSPSGEIDYTVWLTNNIKNDQEKDIFRDCDNNYFSWGFQVSTKLDLTPPQVLNNGIFPMPDAHADEVASTTEAVQATASIKVVDSPKTHKAASIISVTKNSASTTDEAIISPNYHYAFTTLSVTATTDNTQAQLFSDSGMLLGVANWDNKQVNFPGFFNLKVDEHSAGNLWEIVINPEVLADRLTIGTNVYIFSEDIGTNLITISSTSTPSVIAQAIFTAISSQSNIDSNINTADPTIIDLKAKVAGAAGNNIYLDSNSAGLEINAFSGGADKLVNIVINDRPDKPMNSIIQINFNEAINPVGVSGSASEVHKIIKVVNAVDTAGNHANVCISDEDCKSYKCDSGACVGDFLDGSFIISNMYKTIEFKSNDLCGQNACGDSIYCLPANSNLSVQLAAAHLQPCNASSDCTIFSPYSDCGANLICQNSSGVNYPLSDINVPLDGIMDAAFNSLDGNRDGSASGPLSHYDENNPNMADKDSYKWQFFINDKIMTDPPEIGSTSPVAKSTSTTDVNTMEPIQINFKTLMLNQSLRTGSTIIKKGEKSYEHHLLNLMTLTPLPLGYWVSSVNVDLDPLDGEPDKTYVYINHTQFGDSVAYKAQVGSGVRDIYQNCFKPSASSNCDANNSLSSCCSITPTSYDALIDGNCP